MLDGSSFMQDWTLVLGLALRGMAPGSHLVTCDDTVGRRVISLFMHALTHCTPLVARTLLGAWFYRRTQTSHTVGLDVVETSDGC
jgi:hypothetical protein